MRAPKSGYRRTVSFPRGEKPRAWPTLGAGTRAEKAHSPRARRRRVRELEHAIERLAQRESSPGVNVIDVQLVAQLCNGAGYAAWRDSIERTWRCHDTRENTSRFSTAAWPRTLSSEHIAVLLLPLPAGRVGTAARNASPIADPVFTSGNPLPGAPRTDPVLELLLTWTQNPSARHTARLAPPVIEVIVKGKVIERWPETFGVDWPLPLADGI